MGTSGPSALFAYQPAILGRFPAIVAGVIHATGVTNGPTPAGLAEAFAATQVEVRERIGDTPLSEIPALAAWRRAKVQTVDIDPGQHVIMRVDGRPGDVGAGTAERRWQAAPVERAA